MTMTDSTQTTPDTATPFTFRISAEHLIAGATVAVAASTDDVTPVITAVQLTATADGVRFTATDRYRVAVMDLTVDAGEAPGAPAGTRPPVVGDTVLLPVALLKQAAKSAAVRGEPLTGTPLVQVTVRREVQRVGNGSERISSERVTIAHAYSGWSHTAESIRGNFPPVARLLPADGAAFPVPVGVRLNSGYLAAMAGIRMPGETAARAKQQTWDMSAATDAEQAPGKKPGPVLFERADGARARVRYLVQPNLLLR